MRKLKFLAVPCALLALAGCLENDGQRAIAGAAIGAGAASATHNNVLTGAAIGAAGGALCNDVGLC
jgi:hypothetical protein